MDTTEAQLKTLRDTPAPPGDHRATRRKAKALAELEQRQARAIGRKWREAWRGEYRGPF